MLRNSCIPTTYCFVTSFFPRRKSMLNCYRLQFKSRRMAAFNNPHKVHPS